MPGAATWKGVGLAALVCGAANDDSKCDHGGGNAAVCNTADKASGSGAGPVEPWWLRLYHRRACS